MADAGGPVPGRGREYRIAAAAACLLMSAVSLGVGGSFAAFNATTTNPSSFSDVALYSPTGVSAAPLGHNESLNWTAPSPNNGNGYVVKEYSLGTTQGSCANTASTYATILTSVTNAVSLPLTDSTTFTAATQGSYECYMVQDGYRLGGFPGTANWLSIDKDGTASAPRTAQGAGIGFFATSVAMANGNAVTTAGLLDQGDTITIDFDQAVNTATPPAGNVCIDSSANTFYLGTGAQAGNKCSTASSAGFITGPAPTVAKYSEYAATYAYSGGGTVLTITVGASTGGTQNTAALFAAGTYTYHPLDGATADFTSNTGAATICTANPASGICLPTTTTLP